MLPSRHGCCSLAAFLKMTGMALFPHNLCNLSLSLWGVGARTGAFDAYSEDATAQLYLLIRGAGRGVVMTGFRKRVDNLRARRMFFKDA